MKEWNRSENGIYRNEFYVGISDANSPCKCDSPGGQAVAAGSSQTGMQTISDAVSVKWGHGKSHGLDERDGDPGIGGTV